MNEGVGAVAKYGSIDFCRGELILGWAVYNGRPARVSVYRNGKLEAVMQSAEYRPDLVQYGLPPNSAFKVILAPEMQSLDDINILFEDGSHVPGSPVIPERERRAKLIPDEHRSGTGVEIGPLAAPMLPKKLFNVLYVDHLDKEGLIRKYDLAPETAARLVEIDHVWDGTRPLKEVIGTPLSFCVAVHVLEHIGDPIGWLNNVSTALMDGGDIHLAIPDRLRTFDYTRTLSTPTQMIEAHHRRLKQPSYGQIFDYVAFSNAEKTGHPGVRNVRRAIEIATEAEASGSYLDAHCHVWDKESFVGCWQTIEATGFTNLSLLSAADPISWGNEFYVTLRKHL